MVDKVGGRCELQDWIEEINSGPFDEDLTDPETAISAMSRRNVSPDVFERGARQKALVSCSPEQAYSLELFQDSLGFHVQTMPPREIEEKLRDYYDKAYGVDNAKKTVYVKDEDAKRELDFFIALIHHSAFENESFLRDVSYQFGQRIGEEATHAWTIEATIALNSPHLTDLDRWMLLQVRKFEKDPKQALDFIKSQKPDEQRLSDFQSALTSLPWGGEGDSLTSSELSEEERGNIALLVRRHGVNQQEAEFIVLSRKRSTYSQFSHYHRRFLLLSIFDRQYRKYFGELMKKDVCGDDIGELQTFVRIFMGGDPLINSKDLALIRRRLQPAATDRAIVGTSETKWADIRSAKPNQAYLIPIRGIGTSSEGRSDPLNLTHEILMDGARTLYDLWNEHAEWIIVTPNRCYKEEVNGWTLGFSGMIFVKASEYNGFLDLTGSLEGDKEATKSPGAFFEIVHHELTHLRFADWVLDNGDPKRFEFNGPNELDAYKSGYHGIFNYLRFRHPLEGDFLRRVFENLDTRISDGNRRVEIPEEDTNPNRSPSYYDRFSSSDLSFYPGKQGPGEPEIPSPMRSKPWKKILQEKSAAPIDEKKREDFWEAELEALSDEDQDKAEAFLEKMQDGHQHFQTLEKNHPVARVISRRLNESGWGEFDAIRFSSSKWPQIEAFLYSAEK